MANRPRFVVGCAAVAVSLLGVVSAGQDTTLRYKWTMGETTRYQLEQQTSVNMSGVPGMGEMAMTLQMNQVLAMTAKAVAPNGTATLENRVESMRMDIGSPMMSMSYDSTKPAPTDPMGAQMAQSMAPLLKTPFTMVLTPTGTIERVEGLTAMMQQSGAAAPQMPGMPGMDSMLSDDAMKAMFGQSFTALPAGAVKAGDTWKQELAIPNPLGAITATLVNTMRGLEALDGRNVARFSTTTTMKSAPGGSAAAGLPMTVTMGDGTGESETWFDPARGRVVRSTGTTSLPMTMSMTGPDGSALSMQASTVVKTTLTLIEK